MGARPFVNRYIYIYLRMFFLFLSESIKLNEFSKNFFFQFLVQGTVPCTFFYCKFTLLLQIFDGDSLLYCHRIEVRKALGG